MADTAPIASAPPPPVKAAPVAVAATEAPPAASAPPVSQNPVKDYLATNKALPSYITSAPSKPVAATETPQPNSLTPAAQRLATRFDSAPSPGRASGAATSGVASEPQSVPLPQPAPVRVAHVVDRTVTEADLKDWKSGTLEDYLRAHGLLSGGN
ncbi:MAG TPA: hypothetical protein VL418_05930 [Devosiaceae bacterium]|nr:hypothetical protein [Devosiaceae bacterium]